MTLTMRLPSPSKYLEGQMVSGDIPSASAISFSPLSHERVNAFACVADASPAFRESSARDVPRFFSTAIISAGGPVLLHHAATLPINFTQSAVRNQRGAFSPSVKYQTSSHNNPVSVFSVLGSAVRSSRSWSSVRQYSHNESGLGSKCSGVAGRVSAVRLSTESYRD